MPSSLIVHFTHIANLHGVTAKQNLSYTMNSLWSESVACAPLQLLLCLVTAESHARVP